MDLEMHFANTHIHSPYSFSSFDSIEQAVRFGREEQIEILGINDLNTIEGFTQFAASCEKNNIYPLYNIELTAFSKEDKEKLIRWNDQQKAGIIHLTGKGLRLSPKFTADSKNILAATWKSSQDRIWKMINEINGILLDKRIGIELEYNSLRAEFAKSAVCDRHIAKALYLDVIRKYNDPLRLFQRLFDDFTFCKDPFDSEVMQNEIYNRLLKTGKCAYVEEKIENFLTLDQAKKIILEAGGIPCYTMLCDEIAGFTECEKNIGTLAMKLHNLGIYAVEFIPHRNSYEYLKTAAEFFRTKGFFVTFGTDHDSPGIFSLKPSARNGCGLDKDLLDWGYEGACILAAHQEVRTCKRTGFVDDQGKIAVSKVQMKDFIHVGKEAVKKITGKKQLSFCIS
jgi:hypothetical protein